jgi:substrate import-associated zinc metallohydrolase lipoprotein
MMMNRIYYYISLLFAACLLGSCGSEKLNSTSIFDDASAEEQNDFDAWLYTHYTKPYNMSVQYHLADIETDYKYTVAPADYSKSVSLAHLILYVWLEGYDEAVSSSFTRKYAPKMLQFVGSPAYADNGVRLYGFTEGGAKITLFDVNSLALDTTLLTANYLEPMHHEFTRLLLQNVAHSTEFNSITESGYVGGDWNKRSAAEACAAGFVTPRAMNDVETDFAETAAIYITDSASQWQALRNAADSKGMALLDQKIKIVREYFESTWNVDLDKVRKVMKTRVDDVVNSRVDLLSLK